MQIISRKVKQKTQALNAFGLTHLPLQLGLLAAGVVCYIALTGLALKSAATSFEETDL